MRIKLQILATASIVALFWACGGGSSTTTPTSPTGAATTTTFQGTVASSALQTGTLTVTVQGVVTTVSAWHFALPFVATLHAQTLTANGTLRLAGGATTALTGTYDPASRKLTLSGGGYTFNGSLSNAVLSGTIAGPSGFNGGFSSRDTTSGAVTVYCGTIRQNSGNVTVGVFNLEVATSGAVSGAYCVREDNAGGLAPCGTISGQVTGTTIAVTHGDSHSTGTIQGGAVSGVSNTNNPWSGSTSACQ